MPTSYSRRLPERVRNELRFRAIHVAEKTRIAGTFWRIVFTGDDLKGFHSPGFDDHIKVFFPLLTARRWHCRRSTMTVFSGKADCALSRATIRRWRLMVRPSLTLDFYIHDSGVASDWASQAQPGDRLIIGGPRGSLLVPTDYAFQLYVCDETGLPAFRRRSSSVEAQALHLLPLLMR
ncbi:siderophore-interacting protein [Pantoea ananatis]|uniref:siderophore-interacting protein n=1 Tax=Pantoea ananas TaxID=553 RepID=UPI000B121079|nr:siderophore-interacting protein [Pantoea ananatis]